MNKTWLISLLSLTDRYDILWLAGKENKDHMKTQA
jgi:hypothetical protein